MCVSVALQQWRHQDTWHHTDVTQHSTLQDANDGLTWKMRHRRGHQQGARNPTSSYSCTGLRICTVAYNLKKLKQRNSTDRQHSLAHSNVYSWGLHYRCVWPLWTFTSFIERSENWSTAKDNFRHLCNELQEETWYLHFPLGNCPMLRHFDASALTGCNKLLCTWCFSTGKPFLFLSCSFFFSSPFFPSKKYLLAALN